MIPVFLGSDILLDVKSPDGATDTVERRCKLNVNAPYLLKKVSCLTISGYDPNNSLRVFSTSEIHLFHEEVIYTVTCA